ncbi:hypothetical protein SprV_0501925300 [Sparganum proliferum]
MQRFQPSSVAQLSASSLPTPCEQIVTQIAAMAEEKASLKLQLARLTSSRSSSRRRSRSRPPTADACWYHINSGPKALRCSSPCAVKSKQGNQRFLVDTGAKISVVSPTPAERRFPRPGLYLQAAKCSPILSFGSLPLTLDIWLRRSFSRVFVIAEVPHAILSSEFLAEFNLFLTANDPESSAAQLVSLILLEPFFADAVFSKIDLVHAFHHIPVAPEEIPRTAVTAPTGLFEFIHMPFDFRNAAQTFHRFIDHVLRGLPIVYVYTDDFLVASRNEEEHKEHLPSVFEFLDKFDVDTNPSTLKQLVISPTNFQESAAAIPRHGQTYRRFLVNCADLMLPLTNMLSGPKGPLELTDEALTAFGRIKNYLVDVTLPTHPAPRAQLYLMVNASTVAVGAVFQQRLAGSTRPLAFFFKKLLPAETYYSTFGRELLAIYMAMQHFRHFL